MKIISLPRHSGKTARLIQEAHRNGGYIIVHNKTEAERVAKLAVEMDLSIRFPITYDAFVSQRYHSPGIKCFLIDNAEMLLQSMTNTPIEAITFTCQMDDNAP